MLRTKTADRIVCITTVIMLIAAVCLWGLVKPAQGDGSHEIGYESLLFDKTKVHTIEIKMDNWDDLLANATAEEYRECEITIDGEALGIVGIRAKGNTSLSSVATLGSSRYSFKVEFDHYQKGKTYHGLDKLSLNNLIQDATMMKDYLAYTLMDEMGVPSSQCAYAMISVNGEDWGLYLAVEAVENSFLDRNGMTKGELYKPDSMSFGGGRGNGRDFDIEQFRVEEDENTEGTAGEEEKDNSGTQETQSASEASGGSGGDNSPTGNFPGGFGGSSEDAGGFSGFRGGTPPTGEMPSGFGGDSEGGFGGFSGFGGGTPPTGEMPSGFGGDSEGGFSGFGGSEGGTPPTGEMPSIFGGDSEGGFGGFGGFNFGMGSEDVKLIYSDDDLDSYSNIFNNAKTKINKKDKKRLIESIRKLNEKEDLDNVVNKEEVITYLAVHNFLCNDDSYTGMMVHNYYLYEEDGKLTIIPWDYNLGFGGFTASGSATSTVNSPIDNPVTSGTTESRPLIAWIFSDEESLSAYHETYSRFIRDYIESGWLEDEITRVQEMIAPYVEKDPTAFYTAEEFDKAVSTMKTFCAKRGESARGQLDGTIPSTTNGQRNSSALIDASDIATSDMGSMNSDKGGGMGGGGFEMPSGMPDMNSGGIPLGMPSNMPTTGTDGDGASFGGSAGASAQQDPTMEEQPETTPAGTETRSETSIPEETDQPAESMTPDMQAGTTSRPEVPDGQAAGGFGGGSFPGSGDFPGGSFTGGTNASYNNYWIQAAICAGILLLALLIIRKAGSHNNG